jgi:hypothetical protein
LHQFPLIEAFWASLDKERPSGDDPKRVARAVSKFYQDFKSSIDRSRDSRWKTPLFKQADPQIQAGLKSLLALVDEIIPNLPAVDSAKLDEIRKNDETVRKALFALEQEEMKLDLPRFPSPKLNQFNYLYEGWRRNFLDSEPLRSFLAEYRQAVAQTAKEVQEAERHVNPRESEEEKAAVEEAVTAVARFGIALSSLSAKLPSGPEACGDLVARVLEIGQELGAVFQTLEQCAPLQDPCPFCGGQLSLSGRCRSCGRRLPHLEEGESEGPEIQSEFISNNCRAVDLALLRWESEPENEELWRDFQEAVRTFASHVVQGRKSLEMLAMSSERPIDSQHEMRKKEVVLKEVADIFQSTLSALSKFSQASHPPAQPLDGSWREPLKEAELKLQELERSTAPREEQEPN